MDSITLDITGLSSEKVAQLHVFAQQLRAGITPEISNAVRVDDSEEAYERVVAAQEHDAALREKWDLLDLERPRVRWARRDQRQTTDQITAIQILQGVIQHGKERTKGPVDWTRLLLGIIASETHRRERDDARHDVTLNPALARDALRGLKQAFEREAAAHKWNRPIYTAIYDDGPYAGLTAIELADDFCNIIEPAITISEE